VYFVFFVVTLLSSPAPFFIARRNISPTVLFYHRMKFRLPALLVCTAALLQAATPIESALELFKAKKLPDARAAFDKIAAADPKNAEAHYYLGILARLRNDSDEAIRQLEQATTLAPAKSEYFADLGSAYGSAAQSASIFSQLGLAKKSLAALEKSVELDPENLSARNGLLSFYQQAPGIAGGSMEKAYIQAAEIRKRNPTMGATVLAQLYVKDKKIDEAFALFEDVLKTAPDNYLALYSIGRTAAQTGQHPDRGEQALRRCLELTPAANEPAHAAVNWRLGNLAEKRGDKPAARAAYEAALKLDPKFKPAADSLAKLK
jgi:tetratricopeptide (TPR) repeat protein